MGYKSHYDFRFFLEKAQKYDGFGEMAKNWKNKFDWLEIQLKNYRQEFIRKSSK